MKMIENPLGTPGPGLPFASASVIAFLMMLLNSGRDITFYLDYFFNLAR